MKFLIFLLSCAAALAQIGPSCPTSVVAGSNLVCSIMLSGGAPAGVQVSIGLPGTVAPATVTAGTASVAAQKQIQCSLSLTCVVYGINQTTIAPGEILHVSIPIPSTVSGSIQVCTTAPVEADVNANSIPVTVLPCVAVSVLPAISKCDINGDGLIDSTDVTLEITGMLASPQTAPDLNKDGVVNILDVEIVIHAALGLGCLAI